MSLYPLQLLKQVYTDLHKLQERFKSRYQESNTYAISTLRDIPPVSGMILWMRQIEAQVKVNLQRVQLILGANWAEHIEGRKLKVC